MVKFPSTGSPFFDIEVISCYYNILREHDHLRQRMCPFLHQDYIRVVILHPRYSDRHSKSPLV